MLNAHTDEIKCNKIEGFTYPGVGIEDKKI